MEPWYKPAQNHVLVFVRVSPGAAATGLNGLYNDGVQPRLKISLNAPPEDGKANKELCRFVAKTLGLAQAQVQVQQGAKNRNKTLLLPPISAQQIETLINIET